MKSHGTPQKIERKTNQEEKRKASRYFETLGGTGWASVWASRGGPS